MSDSRVQYSSEAAVTMVENRFDLVLIAAARVRELRGGHKPKLSVVNKDNGPVVNALQEIEQGLVGRDYLKRIKDKDNVRSSR